METTENDGKKKCVIVDGPACGNMMRILGIDEVNFLNLFVFLTLKIGRKTKCIEPPLYTLSPNAAVLESTVGRAGFLPVIITTSGEQDDQLIRQRIDRLRPKEVSELVLVAADKGFYPHLLRAYERGIKIYLVATRETVPGHERPHISQIMMDPRFNFVELKNLKDWLGGKSPANPLVGNGGKKEDTADDEEEITATGIRVEQHKIRPAEYKEVIVIGSALNQMLDFLWIERIDFHELYDLLVLETGETISCRERPLYILPLHGGALSPALQKSGFGVVISPTKEEMRRFILEKIQALDPHKIAEFVFVGADKMFYPALKSARESGITVYLVATQSPDFENKSLLLSRVMLDPDFSFVELAAYRDKLLLKPNAERIMTRHRRERAPEVSTEGQRIHFSKRIARRETEHSAIARLLEEYE